MPTLRSQRTYPLAFNASAINTGIVAAWDWAGDPANARAGGNGVDHSGNARNWVAPATAATLVTDIGGVTGMDGLDPSIGRTNSFNYWAANNLATLGAAFGTGAYSVWMRVRVPSTTPGSNLVLPMARMRNAAAVTMLQVQVYAIASTGKYHPRVMTNDSTALLEWSTSGNSGVSPGGVVDIHVTRAADGTLKAFILGVKLVTGTHTGDWTAGVSSTTANFRGTSGQSGDTVLIDEVWWNRELSEAEVAAHAADPYAGYTSTAPSNGITVTSPGAGTTIGTSVTVSGAYSGAGAPTGIEASFNGGSFVALSSATISGGAYSGTLSGLAAGTGSLVVRWVNDTTATATVTGITVAAAPASTIAFAPPAIAAGDPYARAHRIFQRNGSNQAAVRLAGTYTGTATGIEYRWRGGAWTTLVASPSGGVFDATVTLTGPGQGALEVRLANATGVIATLANVGVGDVYIVGGQSNHVGMANTTQVAPVAPGANPGWVSTELDLTNTWRPNVETLAQPFSDRTGNLWSAYTNGAVYGSYFGALATLAMAAGVPVAFIPCAMGSTGIAAWQPGAGGPTSLWNAMRDRAALVGTHKAVLWWQGEADAMGSTATQSGFESSLNSVINTWWTQVATPFVLVNINDQGMGAAPSLAVVRAAIAAVAASNTHVLGIADALGAWSDGNVHYNTSAAINTMATRVGAALSYTAIAPTITTQPVSQSVTAGGAATFTVAVSGTPAPTRQWQRSASGGGAWTNISGATADTYATPATTVSGGSANNGDQYRVVVTNSAGNVTSSAATLTVTAAADTTRPTMTGTVSVTPSTTSAVAACPAASDNVAVTAYDASINGGTSWPFTSASTTINLTGLVEGTAYTAQFRARDAAGNVSTPVLSQSFTTLTTAPPPPPPPPPPPSGLIPLPYFIDASGRLVLPL